VDLLSIGREIAQHRKEAGLTQAQLAAHSGVSRATIAALETGAARELGLNKVATILAMLGLELRVTTANRGRPTLDDLKEEVAS
jgi:transcriptional regulator with XRE-family HTH domain